MSTTVKVVLEFQPYTHRLVGLIGFFSGMNDTVAAEGSLDDK
jgi:hypothetical protein